MTRQATQAFWTFDSHSSDGTADCNATARYTCTSHKAKRSHPMLDALKNIFAELSGSNATPAPTQARQLQVAVAGLLHEMMRVDMKKTPEESRVAVAALVRMFAMPEREAQALLDEAGA